MFYPRSTPHTEQKPNALFYVPVSSALRKSSGMVTGSEMNNDKQLQNVFSPLDSIVNLVSVLSPHKFWNVLKLLDRYMTILLLTLASPHTLLDEIFG
jgi:hypothetical protein